jgi:hypothetical protein
MSTGMSEEQIHADPVYKQVESIAERINEAFSAQTSSTVNVEELLNATINNEILAHLAGHRLMDLGPRYAPGPLLSIVAVGMIRMYVEAFMVGAHYQAQNDAELVKIDVPDFFSFPETDAEPRPVRPPADPEQVQAVQELPQDQRRNLFQSILRKDDESATE